MKESVCIGWENNGLRVYCILAIEFGGSTRLVRRDQRSGGVLYISEDMLRKQIFMERLRIVGRRRSGNDFTNKQKSVECERYRKVMENASIWKDMRVPRRRHEYKTPSEILFSYNPISIRCIKISKYPRVPLRKYF